MCVSVSAHARKHNGSNVNLFLDSVIIFHFLLGYRYFNDGRFLGTSVRRINGEMAFPPMNDILCRNDVNHDEMRMLHHTEKENLINAVHR